ncbi:MAG TPA: urea carboxylase-associated family protein, partial [Reyranella sp.]|nr:urea carboxylase-associated family protein [Reyranella sp.]
MKDFPAAYQASAGSALAVDKAFYKRIAEETANRRLVESLTIPIRTGRAWTVPAGHVFRIVTIEGPQVGDLNIWNRHNPRERLWASRTRQLQAAHVTTFDRLWSTLPYLRPLATITADSLKDYGIDEFGGRIHDLLGTRCDPYVNRMLTGEDFDFHCHSNLVRAVAPHGLTELDVHDVLNVFQCTGLNRADK